MMNPLALLDWPIPTAHQPYTRRDTALYALSLGVGADPLDPRQLALVDPWHDGLQALPSQALVLGYPGFWLGDPAVQQRTGIAPWQVLHAAQSVQLDGPLPPEGVAVGETRVTGLVDKGADRGSYLYSERQVFDERSGRRLAVCSQVHFLRQVGGCGSAGEPAEGPRVRPTGSPLCTVDTPTLPRQALLYRLNGDANALHIDPQAAARAGFERPLLHGMCTIGMAVTAVLGALTGFDPARAGGLSVRMSAPVLPGDTLRTEVWADGSFQTHAVERAQRVLSDGHVALLPSA